MNPAAGDATLAARLAAVPATPSLRLVPVRHHSPSCAWQLAALIRRDRPEAVLIEGPAEATALVPYLGRKDAKPPLAVYACAPEAPPNGRRAFYPLAAFSPEWVAVREATRIGARVVFIDRPASALLDDADDGEHDPTLLADDAMGAGAVVDRLVAASGCRDFNHWWDRYFETGCRHVEAADYFRRVLAWCLLLRDATDPATASAREKAMAAQVIRVRDEGLRTLVVTGGMHSEAIASLLRAGGDTLAIEGPDGRAECYLVPYTLGRLDAANDYAAGMPDTGYYATLWQQIESGQADPERAAARAVSLHAARALRARGEIVSLPDAMEAVAMGQRLADLRGSAVGRVEVLDALAGALAKDVLTDSGHSRFRDLLAADALGQVPRTYPRAPLVDDFRRRCKALGLPVMPAPAREKALNLYRSPRHRTVSRLLHQLRLLEVPYAVLEAGPDFAAGSDLERVREVWTLAWTPQTEGRLTECMVYGGQLPDAALAALTGYATRAPEQAPRWLVEALRMGLHDRLAPLIGHVEAWLANERRFTGLVDGLAVLSGAHRAGAALDAADLPVLNDLLPVVFAQACRSLDWSGQMDDAAAMAVINALGALNTLADHAWADMHAFLAAVERLESADVPAGVCGRAAGVLTARGRWTEARAGARIAAVLDAGVLDPQPVSAYFQGFLPLARHVFAGSPDLIQAFSETVRSWDEETFITVLPGLRLAFTALKPREAAALMQAVHDVHRPRDPLAGVSIGTATAQAELNGLRDAVESALRRWGMHD